MTRDWLFYLALALMVAGFALPGLGTIGAQILLVKQ